jgi:hypothetical protein
MGNDFITAIAGMHLVDQEMERRKERRERNCFSSAYRRLAYIRYLSPLSPYLFPLLFSPLLSQVYLVS